MKLPLKPLNLEYVLYINTGSGNSLRNCLRRTAAKCGSSKSTSFPSNNIKTLINTSEYNKIIYLAAFIYICITTYMYN